MSDFDITIDELDQLIEDGVRSRRPWNMREDAILKKYYGKVPTRDIMKHLEGRSYQAVQARASRLGLVCA